MTWGGGWGSAGKASAGKQPRAPGAGTKSRPIGTTEDGQQIYLDDNTVVPGQAPTYTAPAAGAQANDPYGGQPEPPVVPSTIGRTDAGGLVAPPPPPPSGNIRDDVNRAQNYKPLPVTPPGPNDLLHGRRTQEAYGKFDPYLTPQTNTQAAYDANQGLATSTALRDFTEQQAAAGAPGNAQGAYNDARGELNADMRGYYDRAFQNGSQQLNRQMAMRGLGNSGASNMGLRNLAADLYGDYAKEQAGYGLGRAQTLGGLANNADTRQTDWASKIGGLFGAADNLGVNQFDTLLGGATAADTALNSRAGTASDIASNTDDTTIRANAQVFNEAKGLADAQSGLSVQALQEANGWDDATFDQSLSVKLGKSEDQVRRERESYERTGKAASWFVNAIATYYTAGAAAAV